MLAVVRKPHTEISLSGVGAQEIIKLLRSHFAVEVLDPKPRDNDDELVDIETTDWWRDNKYRVLAGARLKLDMTHKELAARSGIRQAVISEYESGKRKLTLRAAIKLAQALDTTPEHLMP